ncbi:MAG: ComEC/Rec2 family competence protein [Filomicrobium sp.]
MLGWFSDSRTQEERALPGMPGEQGADGTLVAIAERFEAERPYWFYWVPVFVGVGALCYFALDFEPSWLSVGLLCCLAVLLRLLGPRGTYVSVLTGIVFCGALGVLAAKVRTEIVLAPILESQVRDVRIEGFVELVEARSRGGLRLTIQPTLFEGLLAENVPARVRVVFRSKKGEALEKPLAGDHVAFTAVLSPPPRASIPGGFDFARYAYFRGIGAVGYAVSGPVVVPSPESSGFLNQASHAIGRFRQEIGDRVTAALPGQTGAIAKALINGDRSGISEETNEAYRASGLFHILSISGLHMAIMGGSIFVVLRFLFALSPWLALQFPIKKWAAFGAIAGSLGYLTISGGSFATERSFIMIVVFFLSILVDRPAIALRNVALAALIILLIFPESVVDPGFQMSFAAVVGLVSSYEFVARRTRVEGDRLFSPVWRLLMFFGAIVGSTLVASLAVSPFSVFHFQQAQHYAVLANLIAVPICNLIVMPAALATLVLMPFGGEGIALWIMSYGLEGMAATARFVAGLEGAVSQVSAIPAVSMLLMVFGGLWLCLWRQRWRLVGLPVIAAGLVATQFYAPPDLLVGDGGRLVMVRDGAGWLTGLQGKRSEFILSRWLARSGDAREPKEVETSAIFSCDDVGCVATIKGRRVAVSKSPASLRDDCRRADVVIAARRVRQPCAADLVIDRAALDRLGTHAVYMGTEDGWSVETVAQQQGQRPWSRQ